MTRKVRAITKKPWIETGHSRWWHKKVAVARFASAGIIARLHAQVKAIACESGDKAEKQEAIKDFMAGARKAADQAMNVSRNPSKERTTNGNG